MRETIPMAEAGKVQMSGARLTECQRAFAGPDEDYSDRSGETGKHFSPPTYHQKQRLNAAVFKKVVICPLTALDLLWLSIFISST